MGSQTHVLEQGLCWSPGLSWAPSSWAGGGRDFSLESGRDSPSEVESDAKSQNGYLFHALHGRALAASQALGHNGTCQIKTKNNFFHVLFNVEISLEGFPVMWWRNRTMHCGSPGGLSQRGVSDTPAFVFSHISPGWCRAREPHPHPCSLVCTLHLDLCPRKQGLPSNCSRGISSHTPMPLTHDFCILYGHTLKTKAFSHVNLFSPSSLLLLACAGPHIWVNSVEGFSVFSFWYSLNTSPWIHKMYFLNMHTCCWHHCFGQKPFSHDNVREVSLCAAPLELWSLPYVSKTGMFTSGMKGMS